VARTWRKINRKLKKSVNGVLVPEPNDEYFLYQTLVGAFPFDDGEREDFSARIQAYIVKSVREAKMYTSWLKPDEEYERACTAFVGAILVPGDGNQFLKSFLPFKNMVAGYGVWNSLSQVLVKIASPGVPDFYQGTELWDLQLVDPDNRRPVDFAVRESLLHEFGEKAGNSKDLVSELLASRTDGKVKLFLTCRALRARAQFGRVFTLGTYLPLRISGEWANHVIAFCRRYRNSWVMAVAPRFLTRLVKPDEIPIGERVWMDTHILCRKAMPSVWVNVITGERISSPALLPIGEVLQDFPVALLVDEASRAGVSSRSSAR
jgi:(1->4)-alpha-D-glucan 1-alpha-D-glucosylmutase